MFACLRSVSLRVCVGRYWHTCEHTFCRGFDRSQGGSNGAVVIELSGDANLFSLPISRRKVVNHCTQCMRSRRSQLSIQKKSSSSWQIESLMIVYVYFLQIAALSQSVILAIGSGFALTSHLIAAVERIAQINNWAFSWFLATAGLHNSISPGLVINYYRAIMLHNEFHKLPLNAVL